MQAINEFRNRLPDTAKDTRLNLQSVMSQSSLEPARLWGVALASAYAARNAELTDAIASDASEHIDEAVRSDAQTATSLMAMNNVYYRFRHMVGKESYNTMRGGLRMNGIAKPASDKGTFELMSIAVSAINGCQACIASHEAALINEGVTEEQIHDAVRIASVIHAAATAVEMNPVAQPVS